MESSSRGTRKDETEETGIFDLICKKKEEFPPYFQKLIRNIIFQIKFHLAQVVLQFMIPKYMKFESEKSMISGNSNLTNFSQKRFDQFDSMDKTLIFSNFY